MALTSRKITAFSKKVADLPDRPSPSFSATQIKAQMDASPEELRVALNGAMDDLTSITPGSSGAEQVGSAPITGVTGNTVYGQLSNIKTQLDTNPNNFANIAVSGQPTVAATAKGDTLNLAGGTGITVTTNAVSKTTTITATGNAAPGAHASSHITGGSDVITNAVASGNAGLMSGADKANLDAISQKGEPFGVTTGTGTTYTVTATPAITSLADGVSIAVKWHVVNGASPSIAPNGLTAKPIWKPNQTAPAAGTLKQDAIATLRYSATANAGTGAFILQGEGGEYGTAGAAQVLAPYTVGQDTGLVTGTMVDRGQLNVTPTTAAQDFPGGSYTGVHVNSAPPLVATGTGLNLKNTSVVSTFASVYTKIREYKMTLRGAYTISFTMRTNGTSPIYGIIYRNGVAVGIERTTSSTTNTLYTEDIAGWNENDLMQIMFKSTGGTAFLEEVDIGIAGPVLNL